MRAQINLLRERCKIAAPLVPGNSKVAGRLSTAIRA
jgi:hypothetical protein